EDRLKVRHVVGTRIDDGHLAMPDNVGAGAGVGERAGVFCDHAPDQRRDLLGAAVVEAHLLDERDHRVGSSVISWRKAWARRLTARSLSSQGSASGGMSVLLTSTT